MITIITTTYNRIDVLKRLLDSLKKQTSKNFQWVLIDDGSTDGTREVFENLNMNELGFSYVYQYKENQGKQKSINFSHPFVSGDYVGIVDSDDELVPNAIQTIQYYWEKYEQDLDIVGITFQKGIRCEKGYDLADPTLERNKGRGTYIQALNNGKRGDSFETIRTSVLLKYPFPEYENEKFIGEGWLWYHVSNEGDTIYINDVVYIVNRSKNGLTDSGRKLRVNNPMGCMECARVCTDKRVRLKLRAKNTILYVCYGSICKMKLEKLVEKSFSPILTVVLYPVGKCLSMYWKKKYL